MLNTVKSCQREPGSRRDFSAAILRVYFYLLIWQMKKQHTFSWALCVILGVGGGGISNPLTYNTYPRSLWWLYDISWWLFTIEKGFNKKDKVSIYL